MSTHLFLHQVTWNEAAHGQLAGLTGASSAELPGIAQGTLAGHVEKRVPHSRARQCPGALMARVLPAQQQPES